MEAPTAWQVIRTVFRCSAELQKLLPDLKRACSAEEYNTYLRAIGTAIATFNVELLDRVLAGHPELERRIDTDIERFGRLTD